MPKQSRGYWSCSYCQQGGFDQYSEAEDHERNECTAVARRMVSVEPSRGMVPLSGGEYDLPSASTTKPPQRYLPPLLGANEPSPLSVVDTLACRSMEFFEDDESRSVGLRCAFCGEPHSYIFPANTRSVGDSVQHAGWDHLVRCVHFPEENKRPIQEAIWKRHAEEIDRRTLMDFCVGRCHQVGIVDRLPVGLIFAGPAGIHPPMGYYRMEDMTSYSERSYDVPYLEPPPSRKLMETPPPVEPVHLPITLPRYMPPPIASPMHDFPFVLDQNRWVCKFCMHLPASYRDPHFFWAEHSPPPPHFIDYHLHICREYQRSMVYEQSMAAIYGRDPRQMHWERPTPPRETPSQQQRDTVASVVLRSPPLREPPPRETDDVEVTRAIELLESHQGDSSVGEQLVVEEDRLLLTDYFYYLMKQLRPVRFSEADRRTRGGKREKVKVGYGGLQCSHCVDVPNSRKFFWSNVDRLANSFAEIPAHVLKCRRCPQPTKDALLVLKNRHAEQMSRLSRGSQKVFFRRMWRRLHEDDPDDEGGGTVDEERLAPIPLHMPMRAHSTLERMRPSPIDTKPAGMRSMSHREGGGSDYSPSTAGSEESVYFLQRPSHEAAKALVDSSMQAEPPTPSSRVLLAIPEDREWLSDTDCFVRRQLEVFCATTYDVQAAADDRKYPVTVGQVGIRCIHCAMTKNGLGARGQAVAYPFSINGIYESAREIERMHLGSRENLGSRDNLITCENLPLSAKEKLESLKGASTSLSSVLRKYFVLAAKALGLKDTTDGIRAGAEPVPIGAQAPLLLTDSPDPPPESAEVEKYTEKESATSVSTLKRKAEDVPDRSTKRRLVQVLQDEDVPLASSEEAKK
jgi:hypothetical protein